MAAATSGKALLVTAASSEDADSASASLRVSPVPQSEAVLRYTANESETTFSSESSMQQQVGKDDSQSVEQTNEQPSMSDYKDDEQEEANADVYKQNSNEDVPCTVTPDQAAVVAEEPSILSNIVALSSAAVVEVSAAALPPSNQVISGLVDISSLPVPASSIPAPASMSASIPASFDFPKYQSSSHSLDLPIWTERMDLSDDRSDSSVIQDEDGLSMQEQPIILYPVNTGDPSGRDRSEQRLTLSSQFRKSQQQHGTVRPSPHRRKDKEPSAGTVRCGTRLS